MRTKNGTTFTHVLGEIKKAQTQVKAAQAAVETAIDIELPEVIFVDRIFLEMLHIRTGVYAETLKTIAQEILGQQNGISEIPIYEYSAKIESTRELLSQRFHATLKTAQDTDAILTTAAKKETPLTVAEKTTINSNLDSLVKLTTGIHEELAREYASELERIHAAGHALRLMQNMDISTLIDESYFSMQFLTEFSALFKEIDDQPTM